MAKAGRRQAPGRDSESVRTRLIDATIKVLARDGFAHASARAIAAEASGVNGLIFYHFGSMDQLLAETARALGQRGLARIRAELGGDQAHLEWPDRLSGLIRAEAAGEDGRAVMELLVGARTSPVLAAEVRAVIDESLAFARVEVARVVGDGPLGQLLPLEPLADLAAAAFLGLEVLTLNGHDVDLDRLVATVVTLLQALGPRRPSPGDAPA